MEGFPSSRIIESISFDLPMVTSVAGITQYLYSQMNSIHTYKDSSERTKPSDK
jgi:hypothetical protein